MRSPQSTELYVIAFLHIALLHVLHVLHIKFINAIAATDGYAGLQPLTSYVLMYTAPMFCHLWSLLLIYPVGVANVVVDIAVCVAS